MADDSEPPSDLSGKVTVDAVPLDATQLPTAVESVELQPRSAAVSFFRSPVGSQAHVPVVSPHQSQFLSASTIGASSSQQTSQPFSPGLEHPCSLATSSSGICPVTSGPNEESSLEKNILKGIEKAVDSVISGGFSSDLSSLESSTKSLHLTPTDVDDADIKEYRDKFPKELKVDYFDAMILYHEDNSNLVQKFLDRINTEVTLKKFVTPKVVLYDKILPDAGMSPIAQLDLVLPYCTYVFLFVTKSFCSDAWAEFSSHACLMNAIENQESRWSVVPVFTEPKRSPTFRIPASVRSLKGIQYWSDDKFYVDSLRKLLEDKLHIRKRKEEDHKLERIMWIKKEKGREMRTAEERKRKRFEAVEQERIREQQHQQYILAIHEHRMQIQEPKEFLDNHGYSGLMSQKNQSDPYFDTALQHHSEFANTHRGSGSAPSSLGQQGMSEYPFLHGGFGGLAGPLSLPSNPNLSRFDGNVYHAGLGMTPSFTLDPEKLRNMPKPSGSAGVQELDQSPGKSNASNAHQARTYATAESSSTASATLSSADYSPLQNYVSRSEPINQQPFSSEIFPDVSTPEDLHPLSQPNWVTDARLDSYKNKENKAPILPTLADGSKRLPGMHSVSKGEYSAGVSSEKTATSVLQQMVDSARLYSAPAGGSSSGMDEYLAQNKNYLTKEKLQQKNDLEEDVPPESPVHFGHQHPAVPQPARGGLLGQSYFHEPMIIQGPAHRGAQMYRAPIQHENYPGHSSRLQPPANTGMSRNPCSVRPFSQPLSRQQYEPHQNQHPARYSAPPEAAYTGYRQPFHDPYAQQFYAPYPPAYGGHPGYQQHPRQCWQYPATASFPECYDQFHVPRPLTGQQTSTVHHHHHHSQGEKGPATTINYIRNVEQLMMASTILEKTRPQVPPEERPEFEQSQWSYSPAGHQNR